MLHYTTRHDTTLHYTTLPPGAPRSTQMTSWSQKHPRLIFYLIKVLIILEFLRALWNWIFESKPGVPRSTQMTSWPPKHSRLIFYLIKVLIILELLRALWNWIFESNPGDTQKYVTRVNICLKRTQNHCKDQQNQLIWHRKHQKVL